MAYIQELTDESGESVYPVTKTNAVYDTNGHRLSDSMLTVGEPVEKLEDIKINADSCNGVVLGIDGEGNRGYFKADGSFSPFSKSLKVSYGNSSGSVSGTSFVNVPALYEIPPNITNTNNVYNFKEKTIVYLKFTASFKQGSAWVYGQILKNETVIASKTDNKDGNFVYDNLIELDAGDKLQIQMKSQNNTALGWSSFSFIPYLE